MKLALGLLVAAATKLGCAVADEPSGCDQALYSAGPGASEADFEDWSVDTHSFASANFDAGSRTLRLRGGFFPGQGHLMYYGSSSNTCEHGELLLTASMFSRNLEGSNKCSFDVSFDGGSTWSDTLMMLGAGDDQGASVRQTFQVDSGAPVDYLLRLSLDADDFWDFCFLESVYVGPPFTTTTTTTTTTEATTTTPPRAVDCAIPVELYSTHFANSAQVAAWSAGSFGFGGLQLTSSGSATYSVSSDLEAFHEVEVFAVVQGYRLSPGDSCQAMVSFDGGQTLSDAIVHVDAAQTSVLGRRVIFASGDVPAWDQGVEIVLAADVSGNGRCVLHATGVSGHNNCNDCPATCGGYSCDDWLDMNFDMTCDHLEMLSCECSGCRCGSTTTSTTSTSSSTTSTSSTTELCQETCNDYSCDFYVENQGYTCEALEEYGCNCNGCSCTVSTTTAAATTTDAPTVETTSSSTSTTSTSTSTSTTEGGDCPETCHGYSCDFWGVDDGTTCEMAEASGCDCSGCDCLATTTTGTTSTSSSTSTSTSTSTTSTSTSTSTTEGGNCPETCHGYSCDFWGVDDGTTCEMAEASGCDCSGCDCLATTTTGSSNDA